MSQPMYLTWEEGDTRGQALALHESMRGLQKVEPVLRTQASSIYYNVAPNNTSVRDGFSREDYDLLRQDEALPQKPRDILRECDRAYRHFGLVRNIIDLMADFTVQGIDIVHPNSRIEQFHKEWFRRVRGRERSERFSNYLYRLANVVVSRRTARITVADEKLLRRGMTAADLKLEDTEPARPGRREIPMSYTFLHPLSVDVVGQDMAPFLGSNSYRFFLNVPVELARKLTHPANAAEKAMVADLPTEIVESIRKGERLLFLDPTRVSAHYYKKDDWQCWAESMLAPILVDLRLLSKMKLADTAALDGAISNIRVWKLGSLEERILPSEATILRLAEMLANNVGGGVMDLVWGPEIDLLETSTEVHKFLGNTKYGPALNFIYQGLGIPPSLAGQSDEGFTNNFLSLKTLIERLEYGRSVLEEFWTGELRWIQRAMGFRFPARVVFDRMTLNDEAAEKQLLLHMADRDYISIERLQEMFGLVPEIEQVRIRREARRRKRGLVSPKASPFHDPQPEQGLEKIFAQSGAYAPSEFGVELEDRKPGEKTPIQSQPKPKAPANEPLNGPLAGPGRPNGSRDKENRKQKVVKPRQSVKADQLAHYLGLAENHQQVIGTMLSRAYLDSLGKKTLRDLTDEQTEQLETARFAALCQHPIDQVPTRESVRAILGEPMKVPRAVSSLLEATLARHRGPMTLEVRRRYQAAVYALWHGSFQGEEDGQHQCDVRHEDQEDGGLD